MNVKWCPNCKSKIIIPETVKNIKIVGGGKMKVTCGNCNLNGHGNPAGYVSVKCLPPDPEENVTDSQNGPAISDK